MEITSIDQFLSYYAKIRLRTKRLISEIPVDKFDWKPIENAFTFAELIIHIANIENEMYAETIQKKPSKYSGHRISDMNSQSILSYFEKKHKDSLSIFSKLSIEDLNSKCETPGGIKITTWKWLRAMIEHEIHHRGQLFTYLKILGEKTTPLYGLTSEEVKEKSING